MNTIWGNNGTFVGDKATDFFSLIDTISRYASVQGILEKNAGARLRGTGRAFTDLQSTANRNSLGLRGTSGRTSGQLHGATSKAGGTISKRGTTISDSGRALTDTTQGKIKAPHGKTLGNNVASGEQQRLQDAIFEANGLYSDMDEIAPLWVEFADKYPLIPFAKWYTQSAPAIAKMIKDNPKKAFLTATALYAISVESDIDTSTVDPISSLIDFGIDATGYGIAEEIYEATQKKDTGKELKRQAVRKLTNAVIPSHLRSLDKTMTAKGDTYLFEDRKKTKESPWVFKKRRTKNAGATQKAVEALTGYGAKKKQPKWDY